LRLSRTSSWALSGPSKTYAQPLSFGLWSLVPYAVYLLAVYWLSVRFTLALTLVSATVAWTAAAVVLLVAVVEGLSCGALKA
jgi:uncharacterized membrane protein (GlpM family)